MKIINMFRVGIPQKIPLLQEDTVIIIKTERKKQFREKIEIVVV